MSIHYLLLICQKSCQPAVLPETMVGCIMYNWRVCAHICSSLYQGQQNLGEAHKYPLHPLRKPRWPQGEILPVWCFLSKHIPISVSWTLPFDISTDCFSLTSVIFTHSHLGLPVHEHQPCRSSLWPPVDLGSSFATVPELLHFCFFRFQKGFDCAYSCWDILWMF